VPPFVSSVPTLVVKDGASREDDAHDRAGRVAPVHREGQVLADRGAPCDRGEPPGVPGTPLQVECESEVDDDDHVGGASAVR